MLTFKKSSLKRDYGYYISKREKEDKIMEQFLRNFFNNDSVCLGLCDLQRKIAGVSFNNPPAHMQIPVQNLQPQVYQQAYAQAYTQQQVQPQQKMSLSQYFAQQQREYAAKQAYASQKQTMVAPQTSQNPYRQVPQQTFQQSLNQPQQTQRPVCIQQSSNVESYIQQRPTHSQQKTTTIINGNMKKVISAAVPARR